MTFDIRNEKEQGIYNEIWEEKCYGDVEPGWTVLDIGANIGFFTLYALHAGARVYAYEPEKENFARLEQHIIQNIDDPEKARAYPWAVGAELGVRHLFLNPENIGGHTFTRDMKAGTQDVLTMTLNNIVAGIGHVDLLKMDCEGAEREIFWTATPETLANIDRVRMEYHPIRPLKKFLELVEPYFNVEVRDNKWDHSLPYLWMTKK